MLFVNMSKIVLSVLLKQSMIFNMHQYHFRLKVKMSKRRQGVYSLKANKKKRLRRLYGFGHFLTVFSFDEELC